MSLRAEHIPWAVLENNNLCHMQTLIILFRNYTLVNRYYISVYFYFIQEMGLDLDLELKIYGFLYIFFHIAKY